MHRAIQIIEEEHRNLWAVLFSLRALVRELERSDETPDFRVFHGLLTYLDSFLELYHHPKEDMYLFPALCRRCSKAEKIVQELKDQHCQGAKLLTDLYRTLSRYEFQGSEALSGFRDAVETYFEFERAHAMKEERELLPLAREHLTAVDWEPIDRVFSDHADPLFGETPRSEYRMLLHRIANLAPPPYGAGEAWKSSD